MGIIYLIINSVNDKKYIGQTTLPLSTRWRLHVSAAKNKPTSYFHSAIRKHGADVFSLRELAQADSAEELNTLERQYIEEYGARRTGYNLAAGGQNINHAKMSEAAKRKVNATKGRKWVFKGGEKARILSHEIEAYLSSGWHLGQGSRRSISIEARQKISQSTKGRKLTDEHRQNIAIGLLGHKCSDATRNRISSAWTMSRKTAMKLRTTKRNEALRGARWITKNGASKQILAGNVQVYLEQGWQLGRIL